MRLLLLSVLGLLPLYPSQIFALRGNTLWGRGHYRHGFRLTELLVVALVIILLACML